MPYKLPERENFEKEPLAFTLLEKSCRTVSIFTAAARNVLHAQATSCSSERTNSVGSTIISDLRRDIHCQTTMQKQSFFRKNFVFEIRIHEF